jgi:ATP-binding cassette subfamily F protein 3
MSVAIASGLGKDVAGRPLLRGVSFKVARGDRLTLSGRNGSGKTTLLRMLAGETPIDAGELSLEKGARVALHDQRPPRERDLTLREYVLSGCGDLVALEEQLNRLEHSMAGAAPDQATLDEYAGAQARLEHAGGYDWRRRAMAVVRGLGFSDADLDRPLATFSGGELTRGSLARTLAGDPDLLLLDEPTNHLDIEAIEQLESALEGYAGTLILVSHDRRLVNAVRVDRTLHVPQLAQTPGS